MNEKPPYEKRGYPMYIVKRGIRNQWSLPKLSPKRS
jgi:hypothetical protein